MNKLELEQSYKLSKPALIDILPQARLHILKVTEPLRTLPPPRDQVSKDSSHSNLNRHQDIILNFNINFVN